MDAKYIPLLTEIARRLDTKVLTLDDYERFCRTNREQHFYLSWIAKQIMQAWPQMTQISREDFQAISLQYTQGYQELIQGTETKNARIYLLLIFEAREYLAAMREKLGDAQTIATIANTGLMDAQTIECVLYFCDHPLPQSVDVAGLDASVRAALADAGMVEFQTPVVLLHV